MKNLKTLFVLAALVNFYSAGEQCLADGGQIVGRNGNVFMQEDNAGNYNAPVPPVVSGNSSAPPQANAGSGQAETPAQGAEIVGKDGNVFMEEAQPTQPASSTPPPQRKPVRILTHNYSNVGVATDPSGNIIPQINRTGQSVQPLGSTMSSTIEMPAAPLPSVFPGQLINVPGYPQPMMPAGIGIVPVGPSASFRVGGMNIGISPTMQAVPMISPYGPGGPVLLPSPGILGSPFVQRSFSGTSSTTIIAPPGGIPINNDNNSNNSTGP